MSRLTSLASNHIEVNRHRLSGSRTYTRRSVQPSASVLEAFLAVLCPLDADDDRHRLAECVLRNLRLEGVEDAL